MILLDYSQIALANIIVGKMEDEDLIRHMILNSIRMYNRRFRDDYGQMVICADGRQSWRYEYYPYYKANRKVKYKKDTSGIEWPEIFRVLNMVRDEIKENLPYKVLHMDNCEADDMIGALVYNTQEFGQYEPVMIISSDKDFIQLQKFNNVKQFSPMLKKSVPVKQEKRFNPRTFLFEHICRGDTGDGIPNVLSDDTGLNFTVDGRILNSPSRFCVGDTVLVDSAMGYGSTGRNTTRKTFLLWTSDSSC